MTLLALSSREAPEGGRDAPSPVAAGAHVGLGGGGDGREVAKCDAVNEVDAGES